ncbi:uncharacterized protein [Drosophila kikkawai]|uniref:Uncharacterized protein n=1 Tax=Drosophila kikkawai TaxID=30033 RepID=A0A6P4IH35_DROKI|nr:uncharacterized protein LOC108074493 [Drosophila kikkawai]
MLGPEVLDEEFECLRRIAQAICQTLARPKDREICRSTLDEVAKFNQSPSIRVKENVHKFMVFYLKVLRWTQKNQPLTIYEKWYGKSSGNDSASADSEEMRVWLQEGTSFFAMKTFEDGSTMVYTAVAKDPKAGWAEFGLKSLMDMQNGCKISK